MAYLFGAYFGELKGGFVRDFPIGFCKELLTGEEKGSQEVTAGIYLLHKLREKFVFEMKVGHNGKVWVQGRMSDTVFIFNALERCVQTFGDRAEIDRLLSVLSQ